jgi:hypothetical protein
VRRFFNRPPETSGETIPAPAPPPNPERLAELEALRGEGGTFAVSLGADHTILVNLPEGYKLAIASVPASKRLQVFPMVPNGAQLAQSIVVCMAPLEEPIHGLEMEHVRSSSTALTHEEPPTSRVLGGLRDLIMSQLASDGPARFAIAGELSSIASQLQRMFADSIADVAVRRGAAPIFGGHPLGPMGAFLGGGAPPAAGDNDFANMMRELMMVLQGQSKAAEAKNEATEARMSHSLMMGDIEMIRTMQQNNTSTPQLDRRLDLLLKRLEADNAAFADKHGPGVVPPDVLRGHPPDGAGGNDVSGVEESHGG